MSTDVLDMDEEAATSASRTVFATEETPVDITVLRMSHLHRECTMSDIECWLEGKGRAVTALKRHKITVRMDSNEIAQQFINDWNGKVMGERALQVFPTSNKATSPQKKRKLSTTTTPDDSDHAASGDHDDESGFIGASRRDVRLMVEACRLNCMAASDTVKFVANAVGPERSLSLRSVQSMYKSAGELDGKARQSFDDAKRSGRPTKLLTPENILAAAEMIKATPKCRAGDLCDFFNLSHSSAHKLFMAAREDLA